MLVVQEFPCHLGIRVDEIQKARIEAAAGAAGVSMSEWVRDACTAALKAQDTPEKVPEQRADPSPFLLAVRRAAATRARTLG